MEILKFKISYKKMIILFFGCLGAYSTMKLIAHLLKGVEYDDSISQPSINNSWATKKTTQSEKST